MKTKLKNILSILLLIIGLFINYLSYSQSDTLYTDTIAIYETIDYLIPVINCDTQEESYIVIGDTMRAIHHEISKLERKNKKLQEMLDDCWSENRKQIKINLDNYNEMLKILNQ